MTLGLRYAARTDVGLMRDGNEDAMYAGPRLLAVADGMGGHAAGEVASRVVIETVAALDRELPQDGDVTEALRAAVTTANGYLRDMVRADSDLQGMGTTLTALVWARQQLGLVHVGDSRAYLFRDSQLSMITHDHTLVQQLIDDGRISADEASTHPQRSWITRALDGRDTVELDVTIRDVRPGDRYLVCSDGLSSYVQEDTMAEALQLPDVEAACDRLVDLALRAGGPDNITVIVADLVEEADENGVPIVGGAAADGAEGTAPRVESPAVRAAELTEAQPRRPEDRDDPESARDDGATADAEDGDSSSRRTLVILAAAGALVVLAALGTFLYIRTQYYVGTDDSPPVVTVYRGVSGHFLGLDLSRVTTRTNLPLQALPDYEQSQVTSGIQASSQTDAERIVATLRQDACAAVTPTPTSTPKRKTKSSPRPAPTPLPTYCPSSP